MRRGTAYLIRDNGADKWVLVPRLLMSHEVAFDLRVTAQEYAARTGWRIVRRTEWDRPPATEHVLGTEPRLSITERSERRACINSARRWRRIHRALWWTPCVAAWCWRRYEAAVSRARDARTP